MGLFGDPALVTWRPHTGASVAAAPGRSPAPTRSPPPPRRRLALRVDVIIDVQYLLSEGGPLVGQLDQGVEALAGLGRHAQHRRTRILPGDEGRQLLQPVRRQFVDAVDDDRVGLFELFAEDV